MLYSRRRDLQSHTAVAVRRIFDDGVFQLFDSGGRGGRLSLDNMTMLADDRLDEVIAVNQCGRRLKEQCEYELWALTRRIVILTGINHPSDSHNPVFPRTFADALMNGIGSLETDAGVRLAAFKAFGPILLDIVPAVYAVANSTLLAHGIDVESREYFGRPLLTPERPSALVPTQQEVALGAATVNLALTSALTQILAKSASVSPNHVDRGAVTANQAPLATNVPPSSILPDGERHIDAFIEQAAGRRTLHDTRRTLQEKLTRDEQVIGDIVTVMFDRLQSDPRMPPQFGEVIARLQLPVLELALKDRSLLTQVHHPVRKLIDLIAEFGLTLGPVVGVDSTARSVEGIIDGLVQISQKEPNAFQHAFDQLDGLFYHHEEATLLTDDDLRALTCSEAAVFAGSQADREIALRLQNLRLAPAIREFILTVWRKVLTHDYLNGGPKGEPWKLGLATLDDIVKSLRSATTEIERRRLAKNLPSFIELLLKTLDTSDEQNRLVANFFAELHRAHELALADKWAEIGGERFMPTPEALATSPSIASPSAALAALKLACGDWIETRDIGGTRRWRLNWVTAIMGTCLFKHYESNTTRKMSCEELRLKLASGEVQRVRGLGLADDVLDGAFKTVSRKARREEAVRAMQVPNSASRGASGMGANRPEDRSALL